MTERRLDATDSSLLVHRDPAALAILESILVCPAFEISEATSPDAALALLSDASLRLLLLGVEPEHPEALEVLAYARRHHPSLPSLLLFAEPHEGLSRQAIRMGATTILRFPLPANQLLASVGQALGEPDLMSMGARAFSTDPVTGPSSRASPSGVPARDGTSGWDSGHRAGNPPLPPTPASRDICPEFLAARRAPPTIRPLKEAMEGPEREIILRALQAFSWNRNETAQALGLNRTTLYKKMKKYGL